MRKSIKTGKLNAEVWLILCCYYCCLSELRLIEVLEEVCERVLHYNVHAEREGSLRYSKGESQTMKTLKQLRLETKDARFCMLN
jgi:TLR4 regulator and MIR-interacting MSAP